MKPLAQLDRSVADLRPLMRSPLRLLALERLLEAGAGEWVDEEALCRATTALDDDLRKCLEPLRRLRWVDRSGEEARAVWRVVPERRALVGGEARRAMPALRPLVDRLRATRHGPFAHIVGAGPRMKLVFEQARLAARVRVPVVIGGEAGTGKALLARAIHRLGDGADEPFVVASAAALREETVEQTLAGRGPGPGADDPGRQGLLTAASGGTLFLAEIGQLGPRGQAVLMRALEERAVRPVGDAEDAPADFRLITATREPLEALVARGALREDLLYAINTLVVGLPSLRERLDDLPALADHFLGRASVVYGVPACPGLSSGALERLARERWPGNMRELETTLCRASLLAEGGLLTEAHVEDALRNPQRPTVRRDPVEALVARRRVRPLEETVRRRVVQALAAHGGNVTAAARELGMSKVTLYRRIKEYEEADPGLLARAREDGEPITTPSSP